VHTAPSLPSLLRTTGLIKINKGVTGVVALLLQYWGPPGSTNSNLLSIHYFDMLNHHVYALLLKRTCA